LGEKVEFQVREKQKQERRPLTDDEKRWRSPGDNGWKRELVPTGWLVFEIKTLRWPSGLPRQWLESEKQPMAGMLPDIVATFVAAGPLLVQQRNDREAAEREWQLAEQRRYEEQQRRKRDANRWRSFRKLAQDWQELATVRDFLTALRSMDTTSAAEIDGRSLKSGPHGPRIGCNGPIPRSTVSMIYSGKSPLLQIGPTQTDRVDAQHPRPTCVFANGNDPLWVLAEPPDGCDPSLPCIAGAVR
jgi:hypothetical protein